VIGAKEAEAGSLSLRSRREGELGNLDLPQLLRQVERANRERLASPFGSTAVLD